MLLSELMSRLGTIGDQYGDIPVCLWNDGVGVVDRVDKLTVTAKLDLAPSTTQYIFKDVLPETPPFFILLGYDGDRET